MKRIYLFLCVSLLTLCVGIVPAKAESGDIGCGYTAEMNDNGQMWIYDSTGTMIAYLYGRDIESGSFLSFNGQSFFELPGSQQIEGVKVKSMRNNGYALSVHVYAQDAIYCEQFKETIHKVANGGFDANSCYDFDNRNFDSIWEDLDNF